MEENEEGEEGVAVLPDVEIGGGGDERPDERDDLLVERLDERDDPLGEVLDLQDDPLEVDSFDDEDAEPFDISLAASHSYMGGGLQPVRGRSILEAGWEGRVPVVAHHGAVFPGETVPMLVPHEHDAALLSEAIANDKLFGLLCPDESGSMVSGYGALCEVFEAAPAAGGGAPGVLSFKARATHRFRFKHMPERAIPMHLYTRMRLVEVRVLPEERPEDPLRPARLAGLDPLRRQNEQLDRRLRSMDAALTGWPLFVYQIFDYARMRAIISEYFRTLMMEARLPEEPVSLSFWVARNLALTPRDRLALLVVDSALLRLYMEVQDITRKSVLCCAACSVEIARRDDIFPMSSEGVHSNYTNLGGYMHDVMTVTRARNVQLMGAPSSEFSWFPGYTWTILVCAVCMVHVGWKFQAEKRGLRPSSFYGLCRNYVTPRAADAAPLPPLELYPRRGAGVGMGRGGAGGEGLLATEYLRRRAVVPARQDDDPTRATTPPL